MFEVVEFYFEVIFYFLTNRTYEYFQVDKPTIQVVECT